MLTTVSSLSPPLMIPERLKTLASKAEFPEGNTLLHQLVLHNSRPSAFGRESYINAVLLSMSDVPGFAVNALNGDGWSALHLAVLKGNLLMVKKLLSFLVNIDVDGRVRDDLNTALHLAAELGNLSIIQELLSQGASVDARNAHDDTALCFAAKSEHSDAVKILAKEGATVNLSCGCGTPLLLAARLGNLKVTVTLVESGADVNFRNVRSDSRSPICCAAEEGNLATLEFLVGNGADVNSRAESDRTPLHCAAYWGGLEIVKFLVSSRADIDSRDECNSTPLHYAVISGIPEIAAFLVDQGADVGAVDYFGRTPLHNAVNGSNLETVKMLIGKGADSYAVDEDGNTPIHYALYKEDVEIVSYLLQQSSCVYGNINEWIPCSSTYM